MNRKVETILLIGYIFSTWQSLEFRSENATLRETNGQYRYLEIILIIKPVSSNNTEINGIRELGLKSI